MSNEAIKAQLHKVKERFVLIEKLLQQMTLAHVCCHVSVQAQSV